jgi:hypothetical protein
MEESAVPRINPKHCAWNDSIGMHRENDLTMAQVVASLEDGQPVIANVLKGRHFVLVVGTDYDKATGQGTTLFVNDPGFMKITYDYKIDVVGWRLFNMSSVKDDTETATLPSESSRNGLKPLR